MTIPVDPLDRFGTGIALPFKVGATGIKTASGAPKVFMGVKQVISTPVAKLPWRCKFGTRVGRLRHMNNSDGLQQLAKVDVGDALKLWEPRVALSSVVAAPRDQNNRNILDLTVGIILNGKTVSVKADV